MAQRRRGSFTRGVTTELGLQETLRQLREMGEHVVTAAKQTLKDEVDIIIADAKSSCPVKTGKLRDSIKAEPKSDGAVYELSANAQKNGFYYGQIVEFSPKINKPFLYPAIDKNLGRFYSNIRAAISRASRTGHA